MIGSITTSGAIIGAYGGIDNDQWCLLQVYMVGSITTSAIYVLFDNDSVRHWAGILVCYIGLGIRETACVRNLAIAIVFFFGNDSVLAWYIVVWLCFR